MAEPLEFLTSTLVPDNGAPNGTSESHLDIRGKKRCKSLGSQSGDKIRLHKQTCLQMLHLYQIITLKMKLQKCSTYTIYNTTSTFKKVLVTTQMLRDLALK